MTEEGYAGFGRRWSELADRQLAANVVIAVNDSTLIVSNNAKVHMPDSGCFGIHIRQTVSTRLREAQRLTIAAMPDRPPKPLLVLCTGSI